MLWQETDLLTSPYGDAENETLQTDIQRFMAIIGFCLMAVFALVQALPVTGSNQTTKIEDLRQRIDRQKAALKNLMSENERLIKDVEQMAQYKEIARSLQKQLSRADADLSKQKEKMVRMAREKMAGQENLADYQRRLSKRDDEISQLREAKARVQAVLEKIAGKINGFVEKKNQPDIKPDLKKEKAKEKKGLYVAFASDRVFLDLLSQSKISLFIQVTGMNKGFQVIKTGRHIRFIAGNPHQDLDLWEVKAHMVPAEILDAFKAWSTLSSRDKMLIVGLTPEISHRIRGSKGISGRLIIKEGGMVVHLPEEK